MTEKIPISPFIEARKMDSGRIMLKKEKGKNCFQIFLSQDDIEAILDLAKAEKYMKYAEDDNQ